MNNKNIKICRNYSVTPLKMIKESVDGQAEKKKYVFQGVFTACSTPDKIIVNRNQRVYTEREVLRHLSYLREAIKSQGCILGELDHPDGRFDIQLKEASHKITDLWYDKNTHCVMGKIELLDTPNGNIAKEIIDAGYPLYVSSRAAGDVDEATKEVQIAQIFTYDIVCTPGFEEARLERVNEGLSQAACKYLNESVGSSKKNKTVLLVTECDAVFKPNKKAMKLMNSSINIKDLCTPLNEDENAEKDGGFQLPEPELNPNKVDDKEDEKEEKKDDKVVKDESPENPEKISKKDDISEDDDEEKEDKKKTILSISGEDEDGNTINTDNDSEAKDEAEIEENRAKILKVYSESDDEAGESDEEPKEDEESSDEGDGKSDEEAEKEIEECNDRKSKLVKKTDDLCAELESVLDQVTKTEAVKESIIRRYPFAISLSESEFAKFAALRPNQKLKCAQFIEDHRIFDIQAINELWSTPLKEAKKIQQNWLKLASRNDIELYTHASKEVQDAIEESAKYVILETQEDVDNFWARTGLRQEASRRMMAEQFVQKYKTSANSPIDESIQDNPLGYSYDFIQMLEDYYN